VANFGSSSTFGHITIEATILEAAAAAGGGPGGGGPGGGPGGGGSDNAEAFKDWLKNEKSNRAAVKDMLMTMGIGGQSLFNIMTGVSKNLAGMGQSSFSLVGLITALLQQSKFIREILGTVFTVIGALVDIILAPLMPRIAALLATAMPILIKMAEYLATAIDFFLSISEFLGRLVGGKLIEFIFGGNIEAIGKMWTDVVKLVDKISGIFANFPEIWSNVVQGAKDFFTKTFPELLSNAWSAVSDFFTKAFPELVSKAWSTVVQWVITNVWEPIASIGSKLWDAILTKAGETWDLIWSWAKDKVWEPIKAAGTGIFHTILNVFEIAFTPHRLAFAFLKDRVEEVVEGFKILWSKLKDLWGIVADVWNILKDFWNTIMGIKDSIVELVRNIWNNAKTEVVTWITSLFSNLFDGLKRIWPFSMIMGSAEESKNTKIESKNGESIASIGSKLWDTIRTKAGEISGSKTNNQQVVNNTSNVTINIATQPSTISEATQISIKNIPQQTPRFGMK